jgi:hypothetical protein
VSKNESLATPNEIGLQQSILAIALALKASPGFNNEALKLVAQKFILEPPAAISTPEALVSYRRTLEALANDQEQALKWINQSL